MMPPEPGSSHRFRTGDVVEVQRENSAGNPRTPRYIRGKCGVVTVLHGAIVNPMDHHGVYPPLCSVIFNVRDVFGGASTDTLLVDLHEDWLAPSGSAGRPAGS